MIDEDGLVVEEVRRGNVGAFAILVRRHQKGLIKTALNFVKRLEWAEEVVQDSFLAAYLKIDQWVGKSTFKSWLYSIVINKSKNKLRGNKNHEEFKDFAVETEVSEHSDYKTVEFLKSAIDDLPPRQKKAFVLREYDGLAFKDIAEIMNCKYDTAKANYRVAYLKLRAMVRVREHTK